MAFDTFDTDSVSTAGVTFTNGNLTAQGGAGMSLAASGIAQALEGKKSGKWYVEFTCVAVSGNVDGVGVLGSYGLQGNLSNSGFIGGFCNIGTNSPTSGFGYFTNNHIVQNNTTQTAVNNTTWGVGDVIGMAIDLTNSRIWWNKNGGAFVGTGGTPNPATNTSGFDISLLTGHNGRVYPAANLSGSAAKFTANFGASSFTGTVPSGFTAGWTNTTAGTYFGTFATTGKGSSALNAPPQNDKAVSKYTATSSGNVPSIVIPYAGQTVGTVNDLKGVIYDNTGVGGLPGALLGVSTNTITSGTYGEQTFNFSGVSVTNGTDYWFGIVSDSANSGTNNVTLAVAQTSGYVFNSGTYASPSNPFGASPSTTNFRLPVIINVNVNVNVNLTGVSATSGVGSFFPGQSNSLTGVSTTSVAGSLSPSVATNLVGASATAQAGSFSFQISNNINLAGIAATAVAGVFQITSSTNVNLVGVQASGLASNFTISISLNVALTGASSTALANNVHAIAVSPTATLPVFSIMSDRPVPAIGAMTNVAVACEGEMDDVEPVYSIMRNVPVPCIGAMNNTIVACEGAFY